MIIGRSTEVATVTATLDRAASGLSAIVVEGEAGIGKTTLVGNAARGARERSFAVMACRPAQSEASLSFGAPADLVAGVEEHELRRLPGPQRRALDAVRLHADPDGDDLQPRAVGIALRSALEGLSVRTPVLVAVDGAQWLDQPSEQALRFALRRLGRRPVAVVAAVRAGPGAGDPFGIDQAVPGGAERLIVGGLSVDALRELIAARLGLAVARPLLVRLVGATGGNPFYALERRGLWPPKAFLTTRRPPSPSRPVSTTWSPTGSLH